MTPAKQDAGALAPNQWEQREFIDTIKQTVAKGATDAQLKMFIEVCKGTGLNPFLKEIWFVPAVGVMAGRDGYLRVANEHPMFDGMETKVERDEKGLPLKATCSVWRKDRKHPITCEAWYSEYKKSSPIWSTYPSAMISKVAEVLALKRSFSINGVVTEEEIGEQKEAAKGAQIAVAKARIEEEREKLKLIPSGSTISPQDIADIEPEEYVCEKCGIISVPLSEHTCPFTASLGSYEQRQAAIQQEAAKPEPKPARKRGAVPFEVLKHFGEIKKSMRALMKTDEDYYRVLNCAGYAHADKIKDTEEARRIYKLLGMENNRLRADAELRNLLIESREQIGGTRFLEILGANGCEDIKMVMALDGAPLQALLLELKTEVDDRRKNA